MGMTGDQYAEQLDALLPQGAAWQRESDARMRDLTRGLGEELSRVDARGDDLLSEVLPSTTVEMLIDWERVAGLPDPCVPEGQTIQERRNALLARLAGTGGQSRQFFIDLAASLGFTITITEFRPFRAGISRAGDALYSEEWLYVWRINAPETTVIEFRAGVSAVGEPLRKWGNELLECVFNRIKPAHTVLLFGYEG
jgi:uncharacterized protein YmfQ (DUF2313 family)